MSTARDTTRAEFEQLALPQLDAMYGVALRLTRNPAEAEDLVQDAMVRAYRFWNTFKQGTSVKAWLFTILRNTFINGYHQSNRRRSARADLASQLPSLGSQAALGQASAPTGGPDAMMSERVTRERIVTALEAIPEDYRMAVILADLEGLAYKEIAEIMDCPIGTVMSRLHRGRRLLYKLLLDHAVELGWIERETSNENAKTIDFATYRNRGSA